MILCYPSNHLEGHMQIAQHAQYSILSLSKAISERHVMPVRVMLSPVGKLSRRLEWTFLCDEQDDK